MEIPIILEPSGGGWRARCRHPVEASATGETRHEATRALEALLRGRLSESFTILPLEAVPDKPWIATAGAIPDDETTEAWLDAIADYRRQREADDRQTISPPSSQTVP
jgi:predicted RNase H-like HicB family nuclease